MSLDCLDDPLVGMYDYGASSHPIHEDARAAKALVELEEIFRLEAAQRARIDELTRPYRLPAPGSTDSNVISLKAHRDALRLNGARR